MEKYRKGDLEILIKDKDGAPIKGARLTLSQKNHEFKFGANLFMLDEMESTEKNEKYKKAFAETFNIATLPFYWNATEPERGRLRYEKNSTPMYRRPPIDLCMEFCEQNGIEPREHALAYVSLFPKWLNDLSVPEIKRELERRYQEISERYADKIPTIEVTNELLWESKYVAVPSIYEENDYLDFAFALAKKYFPKNQLAINEAPFVWGENARTTDHYYSYAEAAMHRGNRIDAIGMQYHLFYKQDEIYQATRKYLSPEWLYRHMDLYARFGKPLQVTEITIPAFSNDPENEAVQAELIEWLYSIWFSHPAMEQIIYWNLVDGYAYVNDPEKIKDSQGDMTIGENMYYGGLFRFDMTPKPAFFAIQNLIKKKWHTDTSLVTDTEGRAKMRGFYGTYAFTVETENGIETREITLSKDGKNNIEIIL
nr:endo-1,4-beta-xylanase [uncultured bacterium]